MSWLSRLFGRKTEEPEPEKLYIPEEHIEKVLELSDAYNSLPGDQDRVAKYRLWRKIHSCVNLSHEYSHALNTENALKPYITENKNNA